MHLPIGAVLRYDQDDTMTVVAARSDRPHPFESGTRWPIRRPGVAARVRQTGRPARSQDYANRPGTFAAKAREVGLHSIVAAPIIVDGTVWGLVIIASTAGPVPDDAEERLGEFTELLGAAIANTQAAPNSPRRAPASSLPQTRPGGGWSGTCTTGFSSVS